MENVFRQSSRFLRLLSSLILIWMLFSSLFTYSNFENGISSGTSRSNSESSSFSSFIEASTLPPLEDLVFDPFCNKFNRNVMSEFYLNYTSSHLFFDAYPKVQSNHVESRIHFAVVTSPKSFKQRRTIRKTWRNFLTTGKDSSCSASLRFYVGKTQNKDTAEWLAREFRRHPEDMVLLEFCDAYENLPLKTVNILKYAAQNFDQAEWIVKIDDDVLPNIPAFFQCFPKTVEESADLYGWVSLDQVPDRNDKYQIDQSRFNGTHFPPFTHGPAYAVRMKKVADILKAAEKTPVLNLEDVWVTGILADQVGLRRKNVTHFLGMRMRPRDFDKNIGAAISDAFFFHGVVPRIVRKAWATLPQTCESAKVYDCLHFMHGFFGHPPEII